MKKMQKGFTLIELLVVIAIIGLLATIALASLNSARTKSADAAVRANLSNMSGQSALYYDDHGSYGSSSSGCTGASSYSDLFADPNITNMITLARASANATGLVSDCSVSGDGQNWAALVGPLKGNTTGGPHYFCIDSYGTKKDVTGSATAVGKCPAA